MVRPVFMPATDSCGVSGFTQEVGNTEFTYTNGNAKYLGPKICVKSTRTAFPDSYRMAATSLREIMRLKHGADIRANYLDYGGCKLVVDSTATFGQAFSGGINTLGVPSAAGGATGQFAARTPDSPVTHRLLEYLAGHLLENLNVQPYRTEEGRPYFKWVGSLDSIQGFKDELGASLDLRAMTTGQYDMGYQSMKSYSWDGPYRGIAHGIDPMPLRANTITNGVPTILEPYTRTAVTNGFSGRPSTTHRDGTYEIGFLCGEPSFQRLVPTYQQVPGFSFPNQLVNGQLEFKVLEDSSNANFWGEFGLHRWQVERAFKPLVPHAVCAVLYRRASNSLANLGVAA